MGSYCEVEIWKYWIEEVVTEAEHEKSVKGRNSFKCVWLDQRERMSAVFVFDGGVKIITVTAGQMSIPVYDNHSQYSFQWFMQIYVYDPLYISFFCSNQIDCTRNVVNYNQNKVSIY